ncbi:MAG: asparagine synthase (glutamine-hydrolyzing) [Bacteroidota bacterium]
MCGIAGIISSHSQFISAERLKRMTDALAHRGPDGEEHWVNTNASAGFGHRRLSIIDLSDLATQPMHYLDRYTIIHNGEIYNYIELKEELQKKGYLFRSHSDTEVILASYDYWNDECVDHFDGMFAFAIWDEKEKELFAARDRFGEKPFFYYFDEEQFLFASEMKAIWAAGIERRPNLKMIFNFLTIGYVDNPGIPGETFFEHIHKLPPATLLKYKPHSKQLLLEKYWDIDPQIQNEKIADKEALEQFDHLFTTSVKRRLRSDVSVGSSLSGGMDSSSVVATISQFPVQHLPAGQAGSSFSAFTAVFPGYEKDESFFSKQVADQFGLQQFTVNITADDLMNDWEKLLHQQEEPFSSASVYAQYKVFELAKQHNVKVLLDGQGADETLAGYHKYYKWYWQELFQKRKLVKSGEIKAARELDVTEKFGLKNIAASLFPDLASVILERQYLLKAIRQEDLNKDFVRLQSKEAYYSTPAYLNLNGILYFNTCTHGLEELLRYADRNSMAHGREIRLPFLNHELVEFIFSLPSHFKIRRGRTKWILRENMKTKLPDSIVWRKDKVGFEPPQKNWMQNPAMQSAIRDAKNKLVKENILRSQMLDKPIRPSTSYEADNFDWKYLMASMLLD